MKNYFILLFLLFVGARGYSQTVIKATDFGVKKNSFENAADGIQNAVNACKGKKGAVLELPGGRIDIWPEGSARRELYISNSTEDDTLSKVKNIAFLFEDNSDVTLEGNNTLIVLHGKMVSFAILNSKNVKIQNIRFDYERPTMSEVTVMSVSPNAIETTIHADSKYSIDSGRISFYGEGWKTKSFHTILFNPVKESLNYSSFSPFLESKAVETAPYNVRFEGDFSKSSLKKGDVLTIRDPYRDNCGGFISRSKDIKLEDVKMHFMHGLGIVSQFSENISLFKVIVAPRENSGRIISSFADCFHFSGCKGLVKVDSCFTSGSHDDPMNVHGTHLQIMTADAGKIKVRFMHHQTYGFKAFFAGDSIAFVNPKTLMPIGTAKLKTAKLINKREMELEVEGSLPSFAQAGLVIENLTWTPEVIVRNSRFERTNTRGLLLTTRRKVLIENNVFYRTGMYPILIADDASSWFESGAVRDVLIRNNTFQECGFNSGSGAINIAPENHELKEGDMVHRNIRIMGNIFILHNDGLLNARSVDGLVFTGNKITRSSLLPTGTSNPSINLTACKNVFIKKNKFDSNTLPIVKANTMAKKDIKVDLNIEMK
ncbi:right-handed parallel beta-helix repeat-containing protein [Pedobacter foliorum]|uniref:right-handed parallel beta-helix repeat-containing protein n=1 Tax=Pedobacter foliorum TaxID=2739058 RepID=UPI0015660246|nr:right-handed parallel beta-helix repeat-containing protein [Pedobacter foliorum]NRF39653.1 right-handed parallel beta-helix repeat-containing protein [Pedobacter foliorum]